MHKVGAPRDEDEAPLVTVEARSPMGLGFIDMGEERVELDDDGSDSLPDYEDSDSE
jgi:hypothetical protein